jgi:predicted amidohydrolase YtcJ
VADLDFARDRLGSERLEKNGYRLKSFLQADLPVSFGSDAPIVSYAPLKTFEAIESDLRTHEKISLSEIYKIFCVNGRQNAGISAKKLLKNSRPWISKIHL